MNNFKGLIDRSHKGDFKPVYYPYADSTAYGHVSLEPEGSFKARSYQTFKLVYTVGPYGIDESGGLSVGLNGVVDSGMFQFSNPQAPNYVSIKTSSTKLIKLVPWPFRTARRPWSISFHITVHGAYLSEGEQIIITFGDKSQGSPGWLLPTFTDEHFTFMVMADVCATGETYMLPSSPTIKIVAGNADTWKAILPSRRGTNDTFTLGVKAEDFFGNPTNILYSTKQAEYVDTIAKKVNFRVKPDNITVQGLPESFTLNGDERAYKLEGLSVKKPCMFTIEVYDDEDEVLAETNPLIISKVENDEDEKAIFRTFWGDLHGQSGETVGTNSIVEYFKFCKDYAFLDVTGHQGNDFQITNSFWAHLNQVTMNMNKDGEFIVFPGYEWSGNTPVGGDHNIFYLNEGEQIFRSSHAILSDHIDIATDANTTKELFKKLAGKEVLVFSHVGGRPANVSYAHDPKLCTSVEVHSDWGTFEWLLWDSIELGHRVGVVCNSDGHKCQPGASYPGAADFGAYGGLTCFMTNTLTRESIYNCIKERKHYGTTGSRIDINVSARFQDTFESFSSLYTHTRAFTDDFSSNNENIPLFKSTEAASEASFVASTESAEVEKTNMKTSSVVYKQDPFYFNDAVGVNSDTCGMGAIVETGFGSAMMSYEIAAGSNIERVEVFNGMQLIETIKTFNSEEATGRMRIVWEGAECRGRARRSVWDGDVSFYNVEITQMKPINAYNKELPFYIKNIGEDNNNWTVVFKSSTTGNWSGFDVWYTIKQTDKKPQIYINTPVVKQTFDFNQITYNDTTIKCGQLYKKIRMFLLPSQMNTSQMNTQTQIQLKPNQDNPLYIKVTTEDGFNAWTSPVYAYFWTSPFYAYFEP